MSPGTARICALRLDNKTCHGDMSLGGMVLFLDVVQSSSYVIAKCKVGEVLPCHLQSLHSLLCFISILLKLCIIVIATLNSVACFILLLSNSVFSWMLFVFKCYAVL